MVDTSIVWRDIVVVEIESFLYYATVSGGPNKELTAIHLLKLVTGVDISTRPVNRSGSPGKEVKRRRRRAAAAAKRPAFLLSIFISFIQYFEQRSEAQS